MRILFAGNKERGLTCLDALLASGRNPVGVIAHPSKPGQPASSVAAHARALGLPVFEPANINSPEVLAELGATNPDLIILGGYGQIVRQPFIDLAPLGCINLHGGRLPQYRGSSPMNWALINGETEFGISVIRVDTGVDTGAVLNERLFQIHPTDTIAELQDRANEVFPGLLLEVVEHIERGTLVERVQDESLAAYYPLRFPDDGIILWDQLTAEQVHNRIRGLTDPYPGASAYHGRRKLQLLRSSLEPKRFYGEPGRVYRKTDRGILVCALDRCLCLERVVHAGDRSDALPEIARYDKLATVRDLAVRALLSGDAT